MFGITVKSVLRVSFGFIRFSEFTLVLVKLGYGYAACCVILVCYDFAGMKSVVAK